MRSMLENVDGLRPLLKPSTFDACVEEMDADHDGLITLDEFTAAVDKGLQARMARDAAKRAAKERKQRAAPEA